MDSEYKKSRCVFIDHDMSNTECFVYEEDFERFLMRNYEDVMLGRYTFTGQETEVMQKPVKRSSVYYEIMRGL